MKVLMTAFECVCIAGMAILLALAACIVIPVAGIVMLLDGKSNG